MCTCLQMPEELLVSLELELSSMCTENSVNKTHPLMKFGIINFPLRNVFDKPLRFCYILLSSLLLLFWITRIVFMIKFVLDHFAHVLMHINYSHSL